MEELSRVIARSKATWQS